MLRSSSRTSREEDTRGLAEAPWQARAPWFGLALLASLILVTARLLTPDSHGVGTHTQLGLPPCGFLVLFGWPCPACGLTTAFAHMARGELAAAVQAHAIGVLLFVLVLASVPFCVWAGARSLPMVETFVRVRLGRSGVLLAWLALAHWCVRSVWYFMH